MSKRRLRVSGCFLEYQGKFLVLLRNKEKPQGNTWGLPAGKVDPGESDEDAILREMFEETGYQATKGQLEHLGDFNFDFDDQYLEFPTYRVKLDQSIEVKHEPDEHTDWRWVSAEECIKLSFVRGLDDLFVRIGYLTADQIK